uniref:NADH dehydrogenase subunit 5 n=1 Tax=Centrotypus laticornis TaxID=2980484 RepID=UPI0028FC7EBA|nr:NADH dehydrogenase subunit 5 [Centrotypus laticornis]UXF57638.1 NADH dehydrogenase subunit 5 [Centrotypus laticornis]
MNKYINWFFFLLLVSFVVFYFGLFFLQTDFCLFMELKLVSLNSLVVYYVVILDWSSVMFISIVLFISSMVVIYSSSYMGYFSFSSSRFIYLVLLFVLSMLLMIISPNLISILLGWDGLGLVSYCLVIYYNSVSSYLSGMITCLTNRLGDIGLLVCISWVMSYGCWNFIFCNFYLDNFIGYLLILSSFTKSAQAPFSCWLPAAMAAPTPVSSLVHSSTLVTAGIYLMIRFFEGLIVYNYIFSLVGLFTMILSSFCANFEFDLSKIIAFSTLSQLGLMVMSLFLGWVDYSFFHMLVHAMFKSLLFLCSGIYIYYYCDNQDIRFMGGCCSFLPLTTACFNISSMALCGIPFLAAFYSKDMLIENSIFNGLGFFFFFFFFFSLGLTCCYSFRLFYYSVLTVYNFLPLNSEKDEFNFMGISVFFMSFFSVVFGCFFNWLVNLDFFWVFLPSLLKFLSLLILILGFVFGFEINYMNFSLNLNYYYFCSGMWFMFGYSVFLVSSFLSFCLSYYSVLYWGEFYLSFSLNYYLFFFSKVFQFYLNNIIVNFMLTYFLFFFFIY